VINHFRCRLLNLDGAQVVNLGVLFAEYVPPDLVATTLSAEAATVRRVLFGSRPDLWCYNLRLRQLLRTFHATDLVGFAYAKDPRVTYLPWRDVDWPFDAPEITLLEGEGELVLSGTPRAGDDSGVCRYEWVIEIASPELIVTQLMPLPVQVQVLAAPTLAAPSDPIPLTNGQTLQVRGSDSSRWSLKSTARLDRGLGDLEIRIASLGDLVLTPFFGTSRDEPWITWRNVWDREKETPLRLAAVLATLAERAEA
jgi:hypothetical protein